jgi:RHS repeat-associated protein
MNLVDRANRQRSLTAMSRTLRSGRIAANTSVSTTTYTYDANGNLVQAGGWSYMWDYLNRMLASGFNNSTTTYAYDPAGNRVLQTSTTSATYYPNKYYSFTSTKSGANTYATSTNYVFNGDKLLATIDQALYNGAATGSPITRYIHPDHLGSTNAVTDQNGSLVQLMDYYPYGATRISTSTYPTSEKRQYIGQYSDAGTSLSYLMSRYYDGVRGQFLSQDPMFWGRQNLADPQSFNVYSYAQGNPITGKDPTGLSLAEYSAMPANVGGFSAGDEMATYRGVPIYSHGAYGPLDDGNIYQCVGFAQRFVQDQSGLNLGGIGNAVAYGDQSALNAKLAGTNGMAIAYANGGSMMPQENDLITWTDGAGNPGHVGVIVQVDFNSQKGAGSVWTAEQNWNRNKALFQQTLTRDTNGNYTIKPRSQGSSYQVQGWTRYGSVNTSGSVSYQNSSPSLSSVLSRRALGFHRSPRGDWRSCYSPY